MDNRYFFQFRNSLKSCKMISIRVLTHQGRCFILLKLWISSSSYSLIRLTKHQCFSSQANRFNSLRINRSFIRYHRVGGAMRYKLLRCRYFLIKGRIHRIQFSKLWVSVQVRIRFRVLLLLHFILLTLQKATLNTTNLHNCLHQMKFWHLLRRAHHCKTI
jgi:hypothetical protein